MTSSHNLKIRLADQIRAAAAEYRLFSQGCSIVLAVSGGADSVCMTYLLEHLSKDMSLDLHVAHFNHRLRGDEAERDASFVEGLAASLHLTFTCGEGNVKNLADEKKISVQEAARILRYEFLEDVRKETGAHLIATAHNADDQAEEVLARLIRGSSLRGLSGIPWRRGRIIRPLLSLHADEIRGFLRASGLRYVEDSSNSSDKYLRNRIRMDLIPYIRRRYNPAITEALNRTAMLLSDDMELIEKEASKAYEQCKLSSGQAHTTKFDIDRLLAYHPALRRRIYRRAVEQAGGLDGRITSSHLFSVDRLILSENPSGCIDLPGFISARRSYMVLEILQDKDEKQGESAFEFEIAAPGRYTLPNRAGELTISEGVLPEDFSEYSGRFPRTIYLDSGKIAFPLRIRSRRPGDRFEPAGRGFECRLKKFLINCRVPKPVRSRIPLVFMDERLVAVSGLEVSEHARPAPVPGTQCLVLQWSCPGLA